MGTCLSKKKASSTSSPHAGTNSVSTAPLQKPNSVNGVTVTQSELEIILKKKNNTVQEKDPEVGVVKENEAQVKKEIFIIKHRKSHDDRERNSKISSFTAQNNVPTQPANGLASSPDSSYSAVAATSESAESMGNNNNKRVVAIAPSTPNMVVVGTSSCTKEEVDAILIQCGRLSRSSSGKATSSSAVRKYSGSKRSFDFDHCDHDAISAEDDQKRANGSDNSEEYDGVAVENRGHHQHRQRHRQSPKPSPSKGRRRTPSREREQQQQQRSSSRERRVSRSPGRRSSETNTSNANASNNNNTGSCSRPVKLVSVPPTVTSLVMDKSNNVGSGESAAAATSVKRVTVKKNGGENSMVGSRGVASPRSQSPARAKSPARANGNAANGKVVSENLQQQQPSLSRNNSGRKAEQSPYRRNPLSEVDPNSLAYPQSNTNNASNKVVQNKPKKGIEVEVIQKPNVVKGVSANCHTKEQEVEIKVLSSVPDNVVVKTMVIPSGHENNLKPQTLTRSRSSRRSRDLDIINPEALTNPPHSYTTLLLEDIQNFHQKNTQQQPSVSLPACLTKACSILEAVADLNSTTTSSKEQQQHPFVESEVAVSDDVMEPSLHKYVTVKRGGSLSGGVVDMDDQESSGSNSFTVSSGQQLWGISGSSWEPNSADSSDCWSSRLNTKEDGGFSAEANKKALSNSKRRECDHQHSGGIGRGRLGSNKGSIHSLPVGATAAAAST